MVNIISSLLVLGAAVVLLLRVLDRSGLSINNKYLNILTADKSLKGSFEPTVKEVAAVFGCAMLFRLIVFLISVFAIYMFKESEFSWTSFINDYLKWDAQNYNRIAAGGYKFYIEDGDYVTLVFYPLYPWLVRLMNLLLRNMLVSGIAVSALLYSGACCYLYKLMAVDYNRDTAVRALVYISVFPHALFFGVMMNESTLLFTMCATLYYIRKHNWKLVGIFGALAALSRLAGILLAIPAAVEWLEEYKIPDMLKQKKTGEVWRLFYSKGLWIFLMLLGTGIYLFCNYKTTGNWFQFLEYEEKYWHQKNCWFGSGIALIFKNLKGYTDMVKYAIWLAGASAVSFAVLALLYGLRRCKTMYMAFLCVYIIINAGITWPISMGRYMACAVPAFMVLADFSERHKWTEPLITASMAISFGIYFVAYFMGKQIL